MIKECPKGCFVTDKNQYRCPKCGRPLLGHGKRTKEEVVEMSRQRQFSNRSDFLRKNG